MDVQILSKKLIKPSVSTPPHLQKLSISFLDQLVPPKTVPFIFYYHPLEDVDRRRLNQLEKSLSEYLTLFYPLAGRYIKEDRLIDCNDEGVEYSEALVDGSLSRLLDGEIVPEELNRFVPDEVEESATRALVAIQINIFQCGGVAIGLRASHRIMDAFTILSMFTNGWAKTCREGNLNGVSVPVFESAILFPPRDISGIELPPISKTRAKVVTKRFVFDAKTILKLKEEAPSGTTKTEVLTAFIWRAQINAARARYGFLRSSGLALSVNLRGRTFMKIPDKCCGNLHVVTTTRFQSDDDVFKIMRLRDFVDQVRGLIRNTLEYVKTVRGGGSGEGLSSMAMKARRDIAEEIRKGGGDVLIFTSLINFPFYEMDFGWGKPAWVSGTQRHNKVVSLMPGKGGDGVEAWVSMEEEDMAFFQNDPEISMSMAMRQVSRNGDSSSSK